METGKVNCSANGKPSSFPCAACKILRRRCGVNCVFAPYFPPDNPHKFTTAHRVFGASNIIKMLQDLPNERRADAVSSMVYEANARLRDPIYGCAGTIHQLQSQMSQLQSQLAITQAELLNMRLQQANLLSIVSLFRTSKQEEEPFSPVETETETEPEQSDKNVDHSMDVFQDQSNDTFSSGLDPLMMWEPLWI
ncbi:hypothetical protein SUGI_0321570 [Cryptomeria japonica]|uniref:LOB domain-containing protein 1 isoform X2 n=1 Tax=Cryptomeria japonica TaxID=3369 RepID=UPI002408C925|nr:LOB domain-containing protein 1 isoform X2 [Cryptomeria japonica]GLJ18190.1 hypothetical protein SUGI_0321570 [Cryptomeria japonica]